MTNSSAPSSRMILLIIMVSYLMIVIDISIVITGLPHIQQALGFSTVGLSWIQNAYTLTFGGFLLLGARAGDLLGRRRMFMLGLAIFTAASVAIGLSPNPAWMITARAIQGIGSSLLAPSTLALISAHFAEGPERTKALSWYAAAASIGATLGLVMGGFFADMLSWRAGFFINLPIGLLLIWGGKRYLHETSLHTGSFDLIGAVLSTIGMTSLVFGLVNAAETSWLQTETIASLLGGLVLLAVFLLHEAKAAQPILPLRLFHHAPRNAAYLARLLFLAGMVGFWFFITQFLQGVLGFSAFAAGMAFLPTTLPNFVVATLVPKLTQRLGNTRLLQLGLTLCAIALFWLGQMNSQTDYLTGIALPMVLIGIGQGCALAPLTLAAVTGVAKADAGAAAGIVNVVHQLGASIGLAVLVLVFSLHHSPTGDSHLNQLAHQVGVVMQVAGLALVVALLVVTCWVPVAHLKRTT